MRTNFFKNNFIKSKCRRRVIHGYLQKLLRIQNVKFKPEKLSINKKYQKSNLTKTTLLSSLIVFNIVYVGNKTLNIKL